MSDELEPAAVESSSLPVLVQIGADLAVYLGDSLPSGPEFVPFSLIDDPARASISRAVAGATGVGNLAAQGTSAAMQAQGLVRLAPETLAQLKTAAPLVKDGWNLGTLASEGRIVSQVKWLPAGGAQAASIAAAMGPALALMAIQFQLNEVVNVAEHNLELTSSVLRVVREEQWAEVAGYHRTVLREVNNALAVGSVTDAIYDEVQTYQGPLATQWNAFERAVRAHVSELRAKNGHKARQQYLRDHGEAIIADVQALQLAQTSWFLHQALRAGHLLKTADSAPQDAALLERLVRDARGMHEKALEDTDWLLDELARELAVIAEVSRKSTFKIGGSERAARDVAEIVRQLQTALASVRGATTPPVPEPLVLPSTQVFKSAVPEDLTRILPLRLKRGERILALADASCDRWTFALRDAGWVAVTDQRVLVTKQTSMRAEGTIDLEFPLDDIRYVRRSAQADKAPTLDIVTTDSNLSLKFPSWAAKGGHRSDAEQFGELVASFMHLPDSEVPEVRIPEATGGQALGMSSEPRALEA